MSLRNVGDRVARRESAVDVAPGEADVNAADEGCGARREGIEKSQLARGATGDDEGVAREEEGEGLAVQAAVDGDSEEGGERRELVVTGVWEWIVGREEGRREGVLELPGEGDAGFIIVAGKGGKDFADAEIRLKERIKNQIGELAGKEGDSVLEAGEGGGRIHACRKMCLLASPAC